jgi:hypothetical protein
VQTELIRQSETEPEYVFRPTSIRYSTGGGFHLRETVGSEAMTIGSNVPSLAAVWRPRYERVLDFDTRPGGSDGGPLRTAGPVYPSGLTTGPVTGPSAGGGTFGGVGPGGAAYDIGTIPALQTRLAADDVHADEALHHDAVDHLGKWPVPSPEQALALFSSDENAGIVGFVVPPPPPPRPLSSHDPAAAAPAPPKSARGGARAAAFAAAAHAGAAAATGASSAAGGVPPLATGAAAASAAGRKRAGGDTKDGGAGAGGSTAGGGAAVPVRVVRHTRDREVGAEQIERAIQARRRAMVHKLTARLEELNAVTLNSKLLTRPPLAATRPYP